MIPIHKDKLQSILHDELLIEAIKAVFTETIEKEKPEICSGDNNWMLGEKYRAYETAKKLIDQTFIDLRSYKIIGKSDNQFNKER